MHDLDPRYSAYGPVGALTLAGQSGMARMRNPAIAAIALANAMAARRWAPCPRKGCALRPVMQTSRSASTSRTRIVG